MIDIHTHILPYIDDGARNVNEALYMMEGLEGQEVDIAVCTPHFDPRRNSLDEFIAGRDKAFMSIEEPRIYLIPASETRYHDLLYQYSDLDRLCINNTPYLLLELSYMDKWSDYESENIEKLINLFQIIPIIAHIERYNALWKNRKAIRQLMSLGCVIQINAGTVIDKSKRRTALNYIKNGYVDVIGSDCHNMSTRPPNLKDAYALIEKELGPYYCDLLKHKAEFIIEGKMIRENMERLMLRGSEL